jgi:hypothetical protein
VKHETATVEDIEQATAADWILRHRDGLEAVLDASVAKAIEAGSSVGAAVVTRLLLYIEAGDMPAATLAPEGRWYRRYRNLEQFLTWASPEALQIYQDTLRAAHEAKTSTPLAPTVEESS